MKRTHILFVILLATIPAFFIGRVYLNKVRHVCPDTVAGNHGQMIVCNIPLGGMTNQHNAFGGGMTEQTRNAGISNSSSVKSVGTMDSSSSNGQALSDDEVHRIAMNAIKSASGISKICSYSVHQEERNGQTFRVVTFLGSPFSDSKIDNYLYKVGINPTSGQILFVRRPAD